jgi:hypothetical protein
MSHHFHGGHHPVGQGSLSSEDFDEMIGWLADRHYILSANEYLHRLQKNSLKDSDICLSFDDALLCQAEIAVPVLRKHKLNVFFFVYSSPFCGDPDPLEIYRYFRSVMYDDIDFFYSEFFEETRRSYESEYHWAENQYDCKIYLSEFPFYTENDNGSGSSETRF